VRLIHAQIRYTFYATGGQPFEKYATFGDVIFFVDENLNMAAGSYLYLFIRLVTISNEPLEPDI
jgi:uncharacterized protein YdaL